MLARWAGKRGNREVVLGGTAGVTHPNVSRNWQLRSFPVELRNEFSACGVPTMEIVGLWFFRDHVGLFFLNCATEGRKQSYVLLPEGVASRTDYRRVLMGQVDTLLWDRAQKHSVAF